MRNFGIMRVVLIILLFLSTSSCVEIANNEILEKVDSLISELDSLESQHRNSNIENLAAIEQWSDTLDLKIRKLFKPVPYEVGKKITSFAQLKADLIPFKGSDSLISDRLIHQKTQLIHLRTDIENGSGRRGQYNLYVSQESAEMDTLRQLITARDSVRTRIIRTFNELETSLDSNLNEIFSKE